MKIISLVGARPQFTKLGPLTKAVQDWNLLNPGSIRHLILHTGQHYDHGMSGIFFEELEIPEADINLGVGSGTPGFQTARMIEGIEKVLMEEKPAMLIIFGDTNSTLAGAVAASKLHIPIGHIEAGLRSFNKKMPEEINRIASDHISDLLFAPTPTAIENLTREGLEKKTFFTGDIMYDAVLQHSKIAQTKSEIIGHLNITPHNYYLATVHRAENTDDLVILEALLSILNLISEKFYPVVFPIHPRTANKIKTSLPHWSPKSTLRIIEPVGYLDMLQLLSHARMAFTDSGGLQKEAFFLNCPCITMRNETEWVETVSAGGNTIAGVQPEAVYNACVNWEDRISSQGNIDFTPNIIPAFGSGNSAKEILRLTLNH